MGGIFHEKSEFTIHNCFKMGFLGQICTFFTQINPIKATQTPQIVLSQIIWLHWKLLEAFGLSNKPIVGHFLEESSKSRPKMTKISQFSIETHV